MSRADEYLSASQVRVWRQWANLRTEGLPREHMPSLPTLAEVTAEDRTYFRGNGGFFIFFLGKQGDWARELSARRPGQDITSFRPGCVAIREDGEPGAWLAVGGSYYAGADSWEKIA